MKNYLIITILGMAIGSTAMASSSKICYGSTKNMDTKGVILSVEIEKDQVTFKAVKGNGYEGTYPSLKKSAAGRDGKTYLKYKGENGDGQDIIMVDEALLESGTTGLIQIRSQGEGFFNSVYVCKDASL